MSIKKILRILIVTAVSFFLIFTIGLMAACDKAVDTDEALVEEEETAEEEEDAEEEIEAEEEEEVEEETEEEDEDEEKAVVEDMKIESSAFNNNEMIPANYTCDGANINPPLTISGIPAGAQSLVLIVDDPDAPAGTWVHWTVWNIDPATTAISENSVPGGAVEGVTGFGTPGYQGPCPPPGTHHYFFKLYALDTTLSLGTSATAGNIEEAMKGHILDSVELIGLYGSS